MAFSSTSSKSTILPFCSTNLGSILQKIIKRQKCKTLNTCKHIPNLNPRKLIIIDFCKYSQQQKEEQSRILSRLKRLRRLIIPTFTKEIGNKPPGMIHELYLWLYIIIELHIPMQQVNVII